MQKQESVITELVHPMIEYDLWRRVVEVRQVSQMNLYLWEHQKVEIHAFDNGLFILEDVK